MKQKLVPLDQVPREEVPAYDPDRAMSNKAANFEGTIFGAYKEDGKWFIRAQYTLKGVKKIVNLPLYISRGMFGIGARLFVHFPDFGPRKDVGRDVYVED